LEQYADVFTQNSPKPGDVGILVNNVGMGMKRSTIFKADPQDIENIIKTNIFSQVMMTKKFI
jgi:short-subunit dehydrogenase